MGFSIGFKPGILGLSKKIMLMTGRFLPGKHHFLHKSSCPCESKVHLIVFFIIRLLYTLWYSMMFISYDSYGDFYLPHLFTLYSERVGRREEFSHLQAAFPERTFTKTFSPLFALYFLTLLFWNFRV